MQTVEMTWTWQNGETDSCYCDVIYLNGLLKIDCGDGDVWSGKQESSGCFQLANGRGGSATLRLNSAGEILEGHFKLDGAGGEWDVWLEERLDIPQTSETALEMARRSAPDDNV
jgi:hypothetical protein